jgi:hypothetical protein
MPKTQSRYARDDFLIPVEVLIPAGVNPDITQDVVQFQFVNGGLPPRAQPKDEGWVDGYWIDQSPGPLLAGILVGPGGTIELDTGRWAAWIKIIDDPSTPVAPVDQLIIE